MSPTSPLPASSTSNFTILDDNLARPQSRNGHSGALIDADVLKELPVNQSPAIAPQPAEVNGALASPKAGQLSSPDAKHIKAGRRTSRLRRPAIEPESFDALDVVAEEGSGIADEPVSKPPSQLHELQAALEKEQYLLLGENKDSKAALHRQVQKHLAATLLEGDKYNRIKMEAANGNSSTVVLSQGPPPPYPGTPSKVAEAAAKVEQTMSHRQSPKTVTEPPKGESSTPSTPRIEDSLAEIDELEEQLEALRAEAITRSGGGSARGTPKGTGQSTPSRTPAVTAASKRVSIIGSSATVRANLTTKVRPNLRRSTSLGEEENDESSTSQNKINGMSKGQAVTNRLNTPRNPTVKSNKPVTVPNFELPGEAVARRLKEQREARLAQQAQGQKPKASPPKPRVSKGSLTTPTFELPGEAISRRKREELQNRLRAQEDEEKKRREFKARPIRNSMGPASLPRETLTSRIRQAKTPAEDKPTTLRARRTSMQPGRPSLPASSSPQARNRNSMIVLSRETNDGGVSSKRSSISVEELTAQKQRVQSILSRNSSFGQDGEAGKRQRELAAKTAREEAAERSRAASREWAEKKRQKEQAAKLGGAAAAAKA